MERKLAKLPRPEPRRFRPRLERLEDRTLLSTLPIEVDTLADEVDPANGMTSLREAIDQARTVLGPDTITFKDGLAGPIHLELGQLSFGGPSGRITVEGGGDVTLVAGHRSRVLEVRSGTTTLSGLTFTGGSSDLGGGLFVLDGAALVLENSQVLFNTASTAGGGIFTAGTLTLTDTVVSDNYSNDLGGGVYVYGRFDGSLTATRSTISHNEARGSGGGIFNSEGVVTLTESFLSDNVSARKNGGAIYNVNGDVTLTETVVENNAARNGGAIFNDGGSLSIDSTNTFGNNQATSGKGDDIYTTVEIDIDLELDIYLEVPKPRGGRR